MCLWFDYEDFENRLQLKRNEKNIITDKKDPVSVGHRIFFVATYWMPMLCFAAESTFFMRMARVMGPTPPGTGVI